MGPPRSCPFGPGHWYFTDISFSPQEVIIPSRAESHIQKGRIAAVSSALVPIMAALYLGSGGLVLLYSWDKIPSALEATRFPPASVAGIQARQKKTASRGAPSPSRM